MRIVQAYWLGSVPYREGWDLQQELVTGILEGGRQDTLLLLEHPAVFTVGRAGAQGSLLWDEKQRAARGVDLVWTDRGGDATYHGPGQLTGYPILRLERWDEGVVPYIHRLERSLIAYLRSLGIETEAGGPGMTGVWAGDDKVAAIGVKLREGVTSHGFALNLTTDLETFNQGIVPCGLQGKRAGSVLQLGGAAISPEQAARAYLPHFASEFSAEVRWGDPGELLGTTKAARTASGPS